MPGHLAEFMREQLSEAWSDREFLNGADQVASKSLLEEMSAAESGGGGNGWAFSEPLIRRSAATLSYLASTVAVEEGEDGRRGEKMRWQGSLQADALRLARLWESLARLGEGTPRSYALLNAACAYELAGYQANAACLARRLDAEHAPRSGGLWKIASTFLQREFVRLGAECAPLVKEPNYDEVDDLPYALALAAAASALSELGEFFLTGDRAKVGSASAWLAKAEEVFVESGHDREFALARGLRALAVPMASRSTWSVLGDLAGEHPAWRRYLMLLARGLGPSPPFSRSISEVWPSQRDAVEKGLLGSSASKIIRMPTRSGKTRVAEMCILRALASPGARARCVYVAPYRALVAEVAGEMSRVFPDLGFTVSGQDGAYDECPSGGEEGGGRAPADILVATPERLDLVLRASPGSLDGTSLFVIDGGHSVGDAGRGLKMELLLARLRRRFPRARFIVLSAMISDGAMRDLAAWLCSGGEGGRGEEGDGEAVITTGWRPTLQRHARFEWSAGGKEGKDGEAECMLTYEGERDGLPRGALRIKDVIRRKSYEHVSPRTKRAVRPAFPSREKGETAAELALCYAPLGPTLVYAATRESAAAVARKLLRRIEMAEAAGASVPGVFGPRGGLEGPGRSLRMAREWLGDGHDVTRCLGRGIAVHHEGLPGSLRQSIEEDARNGEYAAIVATGTLSQGVSMPVRAVIVHSCRRYDKKSKRSERIPASEYWSLGGRAGRAGHETEGTVVHIVSSSWDRDDYDYYRKERGSLGGVDSRLYSLLGDLAEGRISPEAVDGEIDSEVLGMLAEEGLEGSCEDMVGEVVSRTLAAARANGGDGDGSSRGMDRMYERFRAVARSALELGGDRVKAYGGTGLGREGCEALRAYVRGSSGRIRGILASGSDSDAADLALMALDAAEAVPEMSGRLAFDGDREELVRAWIEGKGASEALEYAGVGDRDGAVRFIDESLGHYAPWGIAAFIRIATAELGIGAAGLPPRIRHLPEMVRYGVPRPEAAWAMGLGVATKRAALAIAADYDGEADFGEFAWWLGGLDREEAAGRYGQDSDVMRATAAASMTRANPLLRGGRSLDEVLGGGADVACVRNGSGMVAAARASKGDELRLERDYDAAHDRNAILVYAGGSMIGRVERDVAQYLAPEIDCGMRIGASVDEVVRGGRDGAGPIRVRVRLQLLPR